MINPITPDVTIRSSIETPNALIISGSFSFESNQRGGSQFVMPSRDWRGISFRALLPRKAEERNQKAFNRFLRSNRPKPKEKPPKRERNESPKRGRLIESKFTFVSPNSSDFFKKKKDRKSLSYPFHLRLKSESCLASKIDMTESQVVEENA